mgnify:CR=1 FL=1
MNYREFGKTGEKISALGFGCMRFPTRGGKIDRKTSTEMIRHAIDEGVNYIDTAYYYHDQESEEFVGEALGDGYAKNLHCHFSKIEWTSSGEKKHLTFTDDVYGPAFEPLIEAIVKEGVAPRIICESAGTMAEDALFMKRAWERARGEGNV